MKHLSEHLDVLLFDYGNTLVEFGPRQVRDCDRAISEALDEMFGPHDFEHLCRLQHHERRAPYSGEFRENELAAITRQLVQTLFGCDSSEDQLARLLDVRFQVMVSNVRVDAHVPELLEQLSARFRLGLISNYPDGKAIRHSLEQHGLDRWFDVVVVSADVGYVKPHPSIFEAAVQRLNVRREAALFVGDNWLGDIQGAKRFGMKAAWTTQYVPYEDFPQQPGDHEPDLVLNHISELRGLLDTASLL